MPMIMPACVILVALLQVLSVVPSELTACAHDLASLHYSCTRSSAWCCRACVEVVRVATPQQSFSLADLQLSCGAKLKTVPEDATELALSGMSHLRDSAHVFLSSTNLIKIRSYQVLFQVCIFALFGHTFPLRILLYQVLVAEYQRLHDMHLSSQ